MKSNLEFPFTNSRFFTVHLTLETMTESQFCVSVGCDGFRKSVSGRIDSSASVPLSPALFLLSLSFSFLPSFSLLPSPSCNTAFVGLRTKKVLSFPAVTVRILCSRDLARICICANYLSLVRDLPSSNMLKTTISVSPFRSTSQTRSCALRMPRYIASITFTSLYPIGYTFLLVLK